MVALRMSSPGVPRAAKSDAVLRGRSRVVVLEGYALTRFEPRIFSFRPLFRPVRESLATRDALRARHPRPPPQWPSAGERDASVMCSAPAKLLGEYRAQVRFALSKSASRSLALVRTWPHGRRVGGRTRVSCGRASRVARDSRTGLETDRDARREARSV